jgi:hypothetical protein
MAGRQDCDATGDRQSAQGHEENDAEKNSEVENLDAGLAGAHRKKKSSCETKRDHKPDHRKSEDHVSVARVKEEISQGEKAGENNPEARLAKSDDAAQEIDDADAEFERAARNPHLDPDEMAHRIGRCFPITERHREKGTSPEDDDVSDADRQIDEAKGDQHVSRKDEEQRAEQKKHCRIESEEDAGNAQLHGEMSLP